MILGKKLKHFIWTHLLTHGCEAPNIRKQHCDFLNIASRMESSGEPGKINISGETYVLIKDKYRCSFRGKIEAKNKGLIDMYFVEGKKV